MRASSTPARPRSVVVGASKPRKAVTDKQPAPVEYGRGWFDATRSAAETTTGRGATAEIGELVGEGGQTFCVVCVCAVAKKG